MLLLNSSGSVQLCASGQVFESGRSWSMELPSLPSTTVRNLGVVLLIRSLSLAASCDQADRYAVLPNTSATNDPSNAHAVIACHGSRYRALVLIEAGLGAERHSLPKHRTSHSGSTVRCDASAAMTHPPTASQRSRCPIAIRRQLHWLDIVGKADVRFKSVQLLAYRCIHRMNRILS